MSEESAKVVYVAIVANFVIAASKFLVAAISGSAAMLAEAFHSAVDTGNELLLLIGLKRSSRPPDQEHQFGYGREQFLWAFIVAISIFSIGGGLSIYEGISRILHPQSLEDPKWNYVVLAIAAIFEGYSWWVGLIAVNRKRAKGDSLIAAILKSKDPSIFTVFIEDTAALIGLLIAFLGISAAHAFQKPALDAIASMLIGLVLIGAAMLLGRETAGLLMGEAADPVTNQSVRDIIASDPAVQYVTNALTMQLGPEEVLLVADVSFVPHLGTKELERAIDRIEQKIQQKHPSIRRIYFEAESLAGKPRVAESEK